MKKWLIILCLLLLTAVPVSALEIQPPEVPDSAGSLMPAEEKSFGQGLWYVVVTAVQQLRPELAQCATVCLQLIAAVMLLALVRGYEGKSKGIVDLIGVIGVAYLLLEPTGILIDLGADTVQQISQYGKLLLPVMAAALAAQGGTTTSAALYTGTALFDTVLSSLVSSVLIPLVYVFLCVSVVNTAFGEELMARIQKFVKWLITWSLKTILYIFTGYISITGVISGTTDQATLKAAKLTISGVVPVVGNILSDASEALLVSAGVVKNAAGVYGMLALLAIAIGPFLQIGVQYLLLKITAGFCGIIGGGKVSGLMEAFCTAMGFLLAMTGVVCVMQIVSTVCFMKGMQ